MKLEMNVFGRFSGNACLHNAWTLVGNCIMEVMALTFEWYMRRLVVKNGH